MWLQTRNEHTRSRKTFTKLKGDRTRASLWLCAAPGGSLGKMLAGGRLGEQKKEMVQNISLRNAEFKTGEIKPFIVCTHLLGMGPDELLEKAKGKTARKTSCLKKQMSKENQLFH